MKRLFRKSQKIVKGTPSAVLLSIAIHAVLFFLAGMLVVFTVVKKKEIEFEPPKAIERPKMKLKKPKVKVRKTSKPKPSTRIVTKMDRASMPDIQLPEMTTGMGEGVGDLLGGFDMMPDFEKDGLFGGEQSIGNDFVGTFYDLNRNRNGRSGVMDPGKFIQEMKKFVQSGWDTSRLTRYYRSKKKLYTTTFAIPPVQSVLAPQAFGEPDASSYCFAVHYKGELVHKEDIKFRFWGLGDDILIVRVNGEIVLNAFYPYPDVAPWSEWKTSVITPKWQTSSAKSRTHWLGAHLSVVGDWITLKGGEPKDMEVLIGEVPGGLFQAMLVVEVEGEEYERSSDRGGPILPIFKTAVPSIDLVESIHADLNPNDACITNGPVFCDYEVKNITYYREDEPSATNQVAFNEPEEIRTWTSANGRTMEAEFMTVVAGNVVLKNKKGKQLKIPVDQLSPEDRRYAELVSPPEFFINFSKKSTTIPRPKLSPYEGSGRPLQISDFIFGARLKQSSTKPYPHELHVEFFAFGEEIDGDNYVLLDHQQNSFTPSKENDRSHEFYSLGPIRLQSIAMRAAAPMRGTKYGGYLITITDERGEIIQHKTSHKWLFKCLENLKKLPVGKHFDKRGIRIGPPRPTREDRPGWV